MSVERVAAIDIGSNSMRLFIDRGGNDDVRLVTVTKLGSKAAADGSLADDAIARNLDCLRTYRSVLDDNGVAIDNRHVVAAATSAVRDAPNRESFLNACEEVLDVRPIVLSGEREGLLSFQGATHGLEPQISAFGETERDLVIDIGGGSTEFVVGFPGQTPEGALSIDAGCVRFSERFLMEFDPPGPEALSGAISVVRAHLDDVDRDLAAATTARRLIGLGGSIATVAAVEIGLRAYDRDRLHRFVLTRAAAEDVFRTLATERRADRSHNPGLPADRVDTIVAGALILVSIMRHYNFDEIVVSQSDILEGLVAELRGS